MSMPCAELSFVGSGDPSEAAHRGTRPPRLRRPACADPCTYYTTPEELDFHASPFERPRVRLTGSTIVSELDRRGDWVRVSTDDFVHLDGAQLTGWVERARLTRIDGAVGYSGGRARSAPMDPGGRGVVRTSDPRIFHGPAHVDAGTPVFALPAGGEPWAVVRDAEAELEVIIRPGMDRAEILRAPFLPSLDHAWVPLTAVHPLPPKQER
jgi:hypothetical protein